MAKQSLDGWFLSVHFDETLRREKDEALD